MLHWKSTYRLEIANFARERDAIRQSQKLVSIKTAGGWPFPNRTGRRYYSAPWNNSLKDWALKTSRASKRFNRKHRKYLEDKFKIGQTTGCKQDPISVSMAMGSAMNKEGTGLFSAEEFLTPKQVQCFFSRMASKVRKEDEDIEAAVEQEVYEETCMVVSIPTIKCWYRHRIETYSEG